MDGHKKVPAGTGTPEEIATQNVAHDQLNCPRCGGTAERLPAGQYQPTTQDSYAYCWTLADGSQPGEPGPHGRGQLCGYERRLAAGLLTRLLRCTNGDENVHPLAVARGGDGVITLALLRYAQQHPMVSAELVALLLDRLEGIELSRNQKPRRSFPNDSVCLTLWLRGRGAAAAITTRHLAEIRALFTDLLDDGSFLPETWWDDTHWDDGAGLEIARINLAESGNRKLLTWPDLQEVGRNG